jgi:3-phenylpropionate/trans-cinnamate dioxygenase ferredoxin reductase subunit
MTAPAFVIVGGGLAGGKAAEALRSQGYDGPLTMVCAELHRPYDRPPLSKGFLQGKDGLDKVFVHPEGWYADNNVELLLGTSVTAIDRAAHVLALSNGTSLPYSKLLIATGSRPRSLPIAGADATGVMMLRTLDDSEALRALFGTANRVVIIGAGWIGLETAAAARAAGVEVTIIEAAELPLVRVLGTQIAQVFADLHRDHGVDLRLGAKLAEITVTDGRASGVRLDDGTTIEGDAVLVGVGIAPNVELAQAAGLEVDNGIVVDASLRTSDPDVFAAGDVANALHPVLGRSIRVEHWANALNQPSVAATAMLGGDAVYDRLPYFYTDQYDLGMEYVGYTEPDGYDDVVTRGNLESREFVAFWTSGGRVVAAMNVNVWDVVDDLRSLILSGKEIPRERLADSSVPLNTLAS